VTNSIALGLGVALLAAVAGDLALNDGAVLLFLARRLAVLIEWMAFWR
jgi:hypothetical protein